VLNPTRGAPDDRGRQVAAVLAGAWRTAPPPLVLAPQDLAAIAPLLLGASAGGLVWWRLRHAPPEDPDTAGRFRQAYRFHSLQAALHERDILRAVTALRSAGIEPLLFKGWATARWYPEPGLRPYGDVDLWVPPGRRAAARAVLDAASDEGCTADLHEELHEGIPALHGDRAWHELWVRSVDVRVGGLTVRALGPADEVRALCLHLLGHGAWRALWMCDLGALLETRPSGLDWDAVLAGPRRRARWIACALRVAEHLLDVPLGDAPAAVRRAVPPPWIEATVLRQWGIGFRHHEPLLFHLRQRSDILRTIRQGWPDPIMASVGMNAPFNHLPRLPVQLAHCASRMLAIAAALLHPRPVGAARRPEGELAPLHHE
jgi:hypothetical protein